MLPYLTIHPEITKSHIVTGLLQPAAGVGGLVFNFIVGMCGAF
jgi:hypothetical protein